MVYSENPRVAIVDYGVGNLFSVKHACEYVGLQVSITASRQDLLEADAAILPGVGAFADAMESLRQLDLVDVLHRIAASSKPLVGICLGMQLLMTESFEFGRHDGLDIVPGTVVRLDNQSEINKGLKVPQVCWNRIYRTRNTSEDSWANTPLHGLQDGALMYFVHSFYVKPEDPDVTLAVTHYGNTEFCSSLRYRNVFACQFHPERSGHQGLQIYRNLAKRLSSAVSSGLGALDQ